jgi:hypothetical protein
VYSRNVAGGDTLTFGVSGNLWHGVLVMYDRETQSLWTQLDGRAIEGPLAQNRLAHVPSTFTTWSAWKARHPDTQVVAKPEDERETSEGSAYADYFADPERLFMPRLGEGLGGAGPKDTVFGTLVAGAAIAVTEDLLREQRVVQAVAGGVPIAWIRDPASGSVRVVERRSSDGILLLVDEGTTVADHATGVSIDLDELPALRVDRAFWYAWARSHPGSRILAHRGRE